MPFGYLFLIWSLVRSYLMQILVESSEWRLAPGPWALSLFGVWSGANMHSIIGASGSYGGGLALAFGLECSVFASCIAGFQ